MKDAEPPKVMPRRVGRRLLAAYQGFNKHDGSTLAAAVAYYFALSLFPLMLVLVAGLGIVLDSTAIGQDAQERLLSTIEQQVSPELSQQIDRALRTVSDRATASGPIGFAVLLITSLMIFTQVDHSFNRIWRLHEDLDEGWLAWLRRLAFQRFKAILMLLAAGAFVLASTIASLLWSAIQAAVPALDGAPELSWGVGLMTNVSLNFLAFAAVYRFVPRARVTWIAALSGAVIAAFLWEAGRQILGVYLVRQAYPSAYGVIGSFLAIMLWVYYGMFVVFFGAEYSRVVQEDTKTV